MIDTTELKKSTCKVVTDMEYGTGIFIGADLILTSYHVVQANLQDTLTAITHEGTDIDVFVKDFCEVNDLAILQTKTHQTDSMVKLCNATPILGAEWATHGHPKTDEGQAVGSKLDGIIKDTVIKDNHQHDVILDSGSTPITAECRGYSGSGVINKKNQVTSILRYRDNNAFCAVSIRKGASFFQKNKIHVTEDELDDFEGFKREAFQTIANPFKDICTSHSDLVVQKSSPQQIVSSLEGKLFFPKSAISLSDTISFLKQNADLNSNLWVGWLEFLSYVQMLKGTYTDVNAIYLELKDATISNLLDGVETPITQDIKLSLQFFFTDEKEYFTIARKYLLGKKAEGNLESFKCHIFNSAVPRFGLQPFTRADKNNIVFDIATSTDAGQQIVGDAYLGVLSFNELSAKVAGSQSLAEATENLKQIFVNAIS